MLHRAGRKVICYEPQRPGSKQLEPLRGYEFAIDEECLEHDGCDALSAFVRAGKSVFQVEYRDDDLDGKAEDLPARQLVEIRHTGSRSATQDLR